MTQSSSRTPRERLDAAHEIDRQLKLKVTAAQVTCRGLVPDDPREGMASPRDIGVCLCRVMTILVDVSTLSSRVLAAADDAVAALDE